jgi:formylglycine-generating enzyme required for sulfatase activity
VTGYSQSFKPGDMVQIRKGKFLYGREKSEEEIDHDYYIDVFPVTNRQYKGFIDEAHHEIPYVERDWAQSFNWDREKRTYPEGMEDHPVVLVSYNDAEAFCRWRSEKDGKNYRLPTEKEWEKAARGTDGREYPWGDKFDKEKCNTNESGIAGTTPVTHYPNGKSPYECSDMAGNVWEWTESWSDAGKKQKVLRGGSWYFNPDYARCTYRYWDYPEVRNDLVGFRCARTKK